LYSLTIWQYVLHALTEHILCFAHRMFLQPYVFKLSSYFNEAVLKDNVAIRTFSISVSPNDELWGGNKIVVFSNYQLKLDYCQSLLKVNLIYCHILVGGGGCSVTNKTWTQDWLLDLFTLITATTDYTHLEQFLQQLAPTMHWQLIEFLSVPVYLHCLICSALQAVLWSRPLADSKEVTNCTRFEVFTAVTVKNAVFWDVTLYGSCKNWHFGGTWRLHHQGDKNHWTKNISHKCQLTHSAKKY
jgi:hypothetical protein